MVPVADVAAGLSCILSLFLPQPLVSRLPAKKPLQDEEGGGISDRPEDQVDVYHTFFGIAGLSLMGRPGLQPIDPTFALPVEVVQRLRQRQLEQRQAGEQPALEQPGQQREEEQQHLEGAS